MNILETKNITKSFGNVVAIDDVSFAIKKNEIHAICGENGAGKSTLMNMIFGLLPPTQGEILYKNQPMSFNSPKEAIDKGIGMVHQHFKLVPSLTVFENIMLGQEITNNLGKVDCAKEIHDVQATIDKFGFQLNINEKVANLSLGEQQRVEILKMLHRDVDVLILDEPTAVLTPQETEELLEKLLELKKNGTTIIIITHKLDEVKKVSDRITVIRKGQFVGTVNTCDVNEKQISRLMVGRDVITVKSDHKTKETNNNLLELKNIYLKKSTRTLLENININVKSGEVVGIAGIEGNGQSELISILTGMTKPTSGSINFKSEELHNKQLTPTGLRNLGFSMIPEDRYKHGLNKEMTIWANLVAGRFDQGEVLKNGILQENNIERKSIEMLKKYDIRGCEDITKPVKVLSGGNAQKIIMAREIECNPEIIIMSQPTRGVDIGSIEFIHSQILDLKKSGKAVLLVSSELSEILNLSDRVYVMNKGKVVGEKITSKTNKEELGMLMLGIDLEKSVS